jgi:hypothetical protein
MTRVAIRLEQTGQREEPSPSQWEEMGKIGSYKDTLVHCYRWVHKATRWHNPEEHVLRNHRCERLKERNVFLLVTLVS